MERKVIRIFIEFLYNNEISNVSSTILEVLIFTISDQEIFREADCDLCVDGGNTFCNFPSLRLEQIRVRGINFF